MSCMGILETVPSAWIPPPPNRPGLGLDISSPRETFLDAYTFLLVPVCVSLHAHQSIHCTSIFYLLSFNPSSNINLKEAKTLVCFHMTDLQPFTQCLHQSRCSINICQVDKQIYAVRQSGEKVEDHRAEVSPRISHRSRAGWETQGNMSPEAKGSDHVEPGEAENRAGFKNRYRMRQKKNRINDSDMAKLGEKLVAEKTGAVLFHPYIPQDPLWLGTDTSPSKGTVT